MEKLENIAGSNSYPGRGIVLGTSEDGKYAVAAYFIMGRSENSRNRIFVKDGEGIRTQAFDPAKLSDPSLIIYAPVRVLRNQTIVTNGDQTDTIYDGLSNGLTLEESLRKRTFEPDAPNYTPRISGLLTLEKEPYTAEGFGTFRYALSILKSDGGDASSCLRFTYDYANPKTGRGHFIHTYEGDGTPLPSFAGEPTEVALTQDIDGFTEVLWASLNAENKVSLFVRYIALADGAYETRIVNKNA